MILSGIGKIAYKYWQEIPDHFKFVRLDQFVIMPDHVHGIIVINNHRGKTHGHTEAYADTMACVPAIPVEAPNLGASTGTNLGATMETNLKSNENIKIKNTYWTPGNLGVIINQYKRICTIKSRKIDPYFQWQPRFYDHIIRNKRDLERIRKYIQKNPYNWKPSP